MKKTRLHYAWILLSAASSIAFVNSITNFTFGLYLKPLTLEFHSGRAIISGARSLNGLLSAVLGVAAGKLTDKYGPRLLLLANGILVGSGLFLMSRANSVWQMYIIFGLILAIGLACFHVPIYSTIPRWFTKKRELALGVVQSGFGLGGMIMAPLIQWIILSYDWRLAYLASGILTLATVIPLSRFMKHSPDKMSLSAYGEAEVSKKEKSSGQVLSGLYLKEAMRTGRFWLFSSILFFFMFCLGVVITQIVAHATDIGITVSTAAGIITFIGGSGIIGKLSVGFLAEKLGTRLTQSIYLAGVTLALVGFLFFKETWMIFLFATLFGIGYGGVITLTAAITTELFGLKNLSTLLSVVMLFGTVGMAVGPIVAGGLFDAFGNYVLAFVVCIALSTLAALLSLILHRYRVVNGQTV